MPCRWIIRFVIVVALAGLPLGCGGGGDNGDVTANAMTPEEACVTAEFAYTQGCGVFPDGAMTYFFEVCPSYYYHGQCGSPVQEFLDCSLAHTDDVCSAAAPCSAVWSALSDGGTCEKLLLNKDPNGTTDPDAKSESFCGDGTCDLVETCANCAKDCGSCQKLCGDGECNGLETCDSCAKDCGQCPVDCGDDKCAEGESCQGCPQDCGECPDCECDRSEGSCQSGKECSTITCFCDPDCQTGGLPCKFDGSCDSWCPVNADGDCVGLPDNGKFCEYCVPDCDGKECGPDGCEGSCGGCGEGYLCSKGGCKEASDCGECAPGLICDFDPNQPGWCGNKGCEPDLGYEGKCVGGHDVVTWCSGDVQVSIDCSASGDFGTCVYKQEDGYYDCGYECKPQCGNKECGDDGCGGSCGDCFYGSDCQFGYCVSNECSWLGGMSRCIGSYCYSCDDGYWNEAEAACCQMCTTDGTDDENEQCQYSI